MNAQRWSYWDDDDFRQQRAVGKHFRYRSVLDDEIVSGMCPGPFVLLRVPRTKDVLIGNKDVATVMSDSTRRLTASLQQLSKDRQLSLGKVVRETVIEAIMENHDDLVRRIQRGEWNEYGMRVDDPPVTFQRK